MYHSIPLSEEPKRELVNSVSVGTALWYSSFVLYWDAIARWRERRGKFGVETRLLRAAVTPIIEQRWLFGSKYNNSHNPHNTVCLLFVSIMITVNTVYIIYSCLSDRNQQYISLSQHFPDLTGFSWESDPECLMHRDSYADELIDSFYQCQHVFSDICTFQNSWIKPRRLHCREQGVMVERKRKTTVLVVMSVKWSHRIRVEASVRGF